MNKLPDGIVEQPCLPDVDDCLRCIGGRSGSPMCMSLPPCTAYFRNDKRDVIFVKDESHV